MHKLLDRIHHLLLPRESNNHRAKILHHSGLIVIITLLLITQFGFFLTEQKYPGVLGITNNISVDDLVHQTNTKRQEQGLSALSYNEALSDAARRKAQHMLDNNYWAHNAPDGTTPWSFFKAAGYEYIFAGENLARGFSGTNEVLDAWMASPGHKENIMSPNYKEIGFAVVTGNLTGEETVLVVEMFGSKNSSVAQVVPTTQAVTQSKPSPTPLDTKPTSAPILNVISTSPPALTHTPSPAPRNVGSGSSVASSQSQPLVNEKTLSKNISTLLVLILLGVLIIDLFLIERKKIIRLISHNVDHIIFLIIILITILIFGKGFIL